MIKDKLMKALKVAASEYNGGSGADAAVVKAAMEYDFNEHQTDRLVEMFNTLAALHQEKSASDPAGSCELADKNKVSKMLIDGCVSKSASSAPDAAQDVSVNARGYDFYSTTPEKTNSVIEAISSGMSKAASDMSCGNDVPEELDVSKNSIFKMISERIDLIKSAGDAADDVARQLRIESDRMAIKIAKAIEHPHADAELADMFKAACENKKAVEMVSEYSTKVAESSGGRFSKLHVFDSSKVDDLLKMASELEKYAGSIEEYEKKRDFYMSKAAECEESVMGILGIKENKKKESIADFFNPAPASVKTAGTCGKHDGDCVSDEDKNAAQSIKIAELIRSVGIPSEEVEKLACDMEKEALGKMPILSVPIPSVGEMSSSLSRGDSIDGENQILLNIRRAMLLSDLMANDPIIREADPNMVAETYKTIVMTAPRVSLDKPQVRSVLRNAINSVAFSPNDAKVLADVDKGVAWSNIDRLTALDSSIKDSNRA